MFSLGFMLLNLIMMVIVNNNVSKYRLPKHNRFDLFKTVLGLALGVFGTLWILIEYHEILFYKRKN